MNWTNETLAAHGLHPSVNRVPIPDSLQDVASILGEQAKLRPNAEALVGRFDRLTFSQLDSATNSAAAFLESLGIAPASRVAACTANHTDLIVAFFAVQKLGAIWVSINPITTASEKKHLLDTSGVAVFLGDDDSVSQVRTIESELPLLVATIDMEPGNEASGWVRGLKEFDGALPPEVNVDPWAPAGIAFTSGTTGFPKGVVHSQHNMMVVARIGELRGTRDSETVTATALPLTILNLMILGPVAAFSTGSKHVCIDQLNAESVAHWAETEKINTLALVPTVVQDLLTSPNISRESLRSVTSMAVGAATVPQGLPELYKERFGMEPGIGYGLTEAPTGVSSTSEESPKVQGAIGQPLMHLEVSIQDDQGRTVAANEHGEICFRAVQEGEWAQVYSPTLGYWNNAEATAELLRGGWVHTGDVGSLDENGELFIHDRRKDLIIRGGANVYPAEIERVLRLDSRVRDCAVVGRPDERLGEVVVAFIEPFDLQDSETIVSELKSLCESELSRYKIPVQWLVVEAMPRNAMGKVMNPHLRDRLLDSSIDA